MLSKEIDFDWVVDEIYWIVNSEAMVEHCCPGVMHPPEVSRGIVERVMLSYEVLLRALEKDDGDDVPATGRAIQ